MRFKFICKDDTVSDVQLLPEDGEDIAADHETIGRVERMTKALMRQDNGLPPVSSGNEVISLQKFLSENELQAQDRKDIYRMVGIGRYEHDDDSFETIKIDDIVSFVIPFEGYVKFIDLDDKTAVLTFYDPRYQKIDMIDYGTIYDSPFDADDVHKQYGNDLLIKSDEKLGSDKCRQLIKDKPLYWYNYCSTYDNEYFECCGKITPKGAEYSSGELVVFRFGLG